jgi:ribosomal protein S4E
MPRTLTDADGNEYEVPTDEELAELQEKAKKAEELENNPEEKNWKEMRESKKRLIDALRAQGKNVDDNGNVIEDNKLSAEDISKITSEQVKESLFESEKERVRAQFPENDRELFDYYLTKLMSNEEKSIANLIKFSEEAKAFVYPPTHESRLDRAMNARIGGVPNSNNQEVSSTAKEMASDFGISPEELENSSNEIPFAK